MATPTQQNKPTPTSSPLAVDTSADVTMSPSDSLSPPSQTKPRSDSLIQATRPAPPSPAPSRPGSQLFNHSPNLAPSSPRDRSGSNSSSRIGSSMNRRVSGASSRHSDREKASRRKSTLGHNFSLPVDENDVDTPAAGASSQPASTGHTTPSDWKLASASIPEDAPSTTKSSTQIIANEAKKMPVHTILIRDYGFPENDERFFGRGQIHTAKKEKWRMSNFTLGRRPSESASGEGSPKSPDPNGSDTDERRGWGFGFLASGWKGFARKRSTSSESNPSVAIHDEPEDTDDVDDDDYFSDDHDEAEEPYGTYRAAYSFEAEGEHEMSMTEGDIIEVRGRGGGEGWVIGVKGGQEGLVPEGYIERYIPGRDDRDDEEMEELQDDKDQKSL